MRRRLGSLILVLALLGLGVVVTIGVVAADRLIHPERQVVDETPAGLGLAFESVSFVAADGIRLAGWWVPAAGSRATVLLLHGYGKSRLEVLPHAGYLHDAGFDVLLFDWRAHGASEGSECSLGFHEQNDLEAAITYATTRSDRPVMALAYSMGAATAILLGARDTRLLALVADSSFATVEGSIDSAFEVVSNPRLPAFPFARLALGIASIRTGLRTADVRPVDAIAGWSPRPILLIAGGLDRVVPPSESERLTAAGGPTVELLRFPAAGHPSSGHEAFVGAPDRYRQRVVEFFLGQVGAGAARPGAPPA